MEQNNSYSVISIVDLFAYCVKKFFVLCVGALIGLVLLLSYHLYDSNTEKKIKSYNEDAARFTSRLSIAEEKQRFLDNNLSFIDKVYSSNPLFNSDDVFCGKVLFSVESKDDVRITETGEIVSEIGLRIKKLWDAMDVSSIVGSEIESDVLKTSFFFSSSGLLFEMSVYTDSEETAAQYANVILDYFASLIDGDSGSHISFKSITASKVSSEETNKLIKETVDERALLISELEKVEEEIKSIKRNAPSKYHIARFSALGFIAGGLVVLLALVIGFVARHPLTSSFIVEKELSLQFLGALFADKDFFSRLSRRIIGEREFKDDTEAKEFIRNTISSKYFCTDAKIKKITVVSSQDKKSINDVGTEICNMFNRQGYSSVLLTGSSNNPDLVNKVEEADAIVFLERQWETKTQLINSNTIYMNACGKKVIGFYLC